MHQNRSCLGLLSNWHYSEGGKTLTTCTATTTCTTPVILNRGPHGPPGGNLQVFGGNTEHLGNWGGMDPFGGNQQLAINSPGCSSGWRIVAASPVLVHVIRRGFFFFFLGGGGGRSRRAPPFRAIMIREGRTFSSRSFSIQTANT